MTLLTTPPSSPSPCSFFDPTSRLTELRLRLKQLKMSEEKINYFKTSDEEAQHEATKVDPSYSLEDEAKRLLKDVKSAMETVKESEFYCKLMEQLDDGSVFQKQIKSFLGCSHSTLNMVIYALGSLEFSYYSIFQLAIALLIKERCCWIEEIEVYDPGFLRADIIVLNELGCNVLSINENARRRVDKPTLFFIPYGGDHLLGNVFEANWCPSQINKLLVLYKSDKACTPFGQRRRDQYVEAIQNNTLEIPLPNYGDADILNEFTWQFFQVDSYLDMDTLISGYRRLSKEERKLRRLERDEGMENDCTFTYCHCLQEVAFLEPYDENTNDEAEEGQGRDENKNEKEDWSYLTVYRGPRMYRCSWHAPPKGWIKLNIASSRGRSELGESLISGYGGICHNEHKEPVVVYSGKIDKGDEFVACLEALKIGLVDILKKFGQPKLIVEADDFKFIHWVNSWKLAPFQAEEFLKVHDLLEQQFDCYVIYHVYEEANEEAIRLAKQGSQ